MLSVGGLFYDTWGEKPKGKLKTAFYPTERTLFSFMGIIIGHNQLVKWERTEIKKTPYGIKLSKTRHKALSCLSAHEKDIYIALRLFANREGYCYPTQRQLAGQCGYTQMTISKNIRKLKEKGWILIIERRQGKGGVRYAYWLKEW